MAESGNGLPASASWRFPIPAESGYPFYDWSMRTGSIPPRPIETPTQPHESNSLLATLVNALSAAAAATAAAAAATTDIEVPGHQHCSRGRCDCRRFVRLPSD